jgi:hypothetical protein
MVLRRHVDEMALSFSIITRDVMKVVAVVRTYHTIGGRVSNSMKGWGVRLAVPSGLESNVSVPRKC